MSPHPSPAPTCDLHLHTLHSDGLAPVAAVLDLAARFGRSAVAITDHDTLAGLEEAQAGARQRGLRWLSGVEISVKVPGHGERHVLAYGFDPADVRLRECLDSNRRGRLERLQHVVDALAGAGIVVDAQDILERAGAAAVGRPHVADALVRSGRAASRQDAFDRWLGDGKIGHVHAATVSSDDAIAAVHGAGGVAVLAHPGRQGDLDVIEHLVRSGLDGIECTHPSHAASLARKLESLAERFGLLKTGGSDNHGDATGDAAMRALRVPLAAFDAVAARAGERAAARAVAP